MRLPYNSLLLSLILLGFVCVCRGQSGNAYKIAGSKINLEPWTLSDWNSTSNDFSKTVNFLTKQYLFESVVALQTNIFDVTDYHLPSFTTEWGSVTHPIPNVIVPGPYRYDEPIEKWGGDTLLGVGIYRYPLIFADFGHTHILAIHARNLVLMQNPWADTTNLDLTLLRMAGGSSFIFAKFALLVDSNGNFLPVTNDSPPVQQIKGLMKMFIFGSGAEYGQPGSILDLNALGGFFNNAINFYGQNAAHKQLLGEIVQRLQNTLMEQLDLDTADPIPLVAWDPLMKAHQMHTMHSYETYRDAYFPVSEKKMDAKTMHANDMYRQGHRFGKQMGAFFSAFYGFIDFMDKLLMVQPLSGDHYTIGLDVHVQRTGFINYASRRYWVEHVLMFEDFNKACAVQDHHKMYEARMTMLESCSNIALYLGEVFRAFDDLIRRREIYDKISNMV